MQKELQEVKNLVHALEERMKDSKFDKTDISSMVTEIHRIQMRLDNLKKAQACEQEIKQAA